MLEVPEYKSYSFNIKSHLADRITETIYPDFCFLKCIMGPQKHRSLVIGTKFLNVKNTDICIMNYYGVLNIILKDFKSCLNMPKML